MQLSTRKKRQLIVAGVAGFIFGTALCPALWFSTGHPISFGIIPISILMNLAQAYLAPER